MFCKNDDTLVVREPGADVHLLSRSRDLCTILSSAEKMDYSLALVLTLLQLLNVSSAAPVPGEVTRMKSKVKWMAEQLVVKLNKDFQVNER